MVVFTSRKGGQTIYFFFECLYKTFYRRTCVIPNVKLWFRTKKRKQRDNRFEI